MRATKMYALNIPRILVSASLSPFSPPFPPFFSLGILIGNRKTNEIGLITGIKEVVTLTSDLSRKNLEKDFERMDTPQGTFYRKPSLFPFPFPYFPLPIPSFSSQAPPPPPQTPILNLRPQASTSTSSSPSTAPNSTPSSYARARLWAGARLGLDRWLVQEVDDESWKQRCKRERDSEDE